MNNPCLRCGTDAGLEVPRPQSCSNCPPKPSSECGEPDDRHCACWVAVADISLADLKGAFAVSDLSLDPARKCCGPSPGLGRLIERLLDEHWPDSRVNAWYLADLLRDEGVLYSPADGDQ